jgi:hypothetical protein
MSERITYWNAPKECDICHRPLQKVFYDCKTVSGPWANLCHQCFKWHGVGLGLGRGQKYKELPTGEWEKIAG